MYSQKFEFEAIGTRWRIEIFDEVSSTKFELLQGLISNLIEDFDQTYSRFRSDSRVLEMSRKAGVYKLPQYSLPLISFYKKLYDLTDGAVTPLIGNVLVDLGYDEKYSLKPQKIRSVLTWEEVIRIDSGQARMTHLQMTIKKPAVLDFGAAGKGYLVDLIGGLMEEQGISSYCIDGGGDILFKNAKPRRTKNAELRENQTLRIGLENPDDSSQVIGVANILNQSICGSAGNRRMWGKFHHIMNPRTLKSENSVKAVWVVADSGMVADGLATALFFVKPEVLEKEFQFNYVMLFPDNTIQKSKKFDGEMFYT